MDTIRPVRLVQPPVVRPAVENENPPAALQMTASAVAAPLDSSIFSEARYMTAAAVVAALWAVAVGGHHFIPSKTEVKTTPALPVASASAPAANTPVKPAPVPDYHAQMQAAVQSVISANPKLSIGVSAVDLGDGSRVSVGNTAPFVGASTTKVITAAAYLSQVEKGKLKLTATSTAQIKAMINRSDNGAWAALNSRVGTSSLQKYARGIGLSSFRYKGNTLSPDDQATLLQKLYAGQLLTKDHTDLVLSFMQQTNNEDMIPAAAPVNSAVYHKYGQLDGYLHDTGIISYKGKTLAMTVYTKGDNGTDYAQRIQVIREVTKAITTNFGWGS